MCDACDNNTRLRPARATTTGFSLIELLIVLAIMGIVTGAVLTHIQSSITDQLSAAAQVVTSDLAYVRNLAVANNSSYRLAFSAGSSQYYFEHAGSNAALDTLPASPHGVPSKSRTRQTTDLALVSLNIAPIEIASVVVATSPPPQAVGGLEFGPLGETTRAEETTIWLAAGQGAERRYLPLTVNPITGNITRGDRTVAIPSE